MKLLPAATLTVSDVAQSVEQDSRWIDYSVAERDTLDADLAGALIEIVGV